MRKLIESTHVALGGEIDSLQDWAFPYPDDDRMRYATGLLAGADRMNSIPRYVASRTLPSRPRQTV